jgi:hypothetical protein
MRQADYQAKSDATINSSLTDLSWTSDDFQHHSGKQKYLQIYNIQQDKSLNDHQHHVTPSKERVFEQLARRTRSGVPQRAKSSDLCLSVSNLTHQKQA